MSEIAYQNKDITAKVMAETLKGKSLKAFGLPGLKIVDILPTNLPAIESNELRLDNLFLLSDGALAIIDYESAFDRENFVKYLNYIARVIKRFAVRGDLGSLKRVKMVVIYTADVECAEEVYDLGGLILSVESAYLVHHDSNEIYRRLKGKLDEGLRLTEEELMELMILPLTVKGKEGKQEAIEKTVSLARGLPEKSEQIKVMAGILTFTDKVIDKRYARRLKEEMQMTLVGQMLMEEGMQKGREEGMQKGREEGIQRGREEGIQKGREEGIQALIQDNIEIGISKEQIIGKLQKRFQLECAQAEEYYDKFSVE